MAKTTFPCLQHVVENFMMQHVVQNFMTGACYEPNIGIALQLGSIGMSKATQFISDLRDECIKLSIAGDRVCNLPCIMKIDFFEYF